MLTHNTTSGNINKGQGKYTPRTNQLQTILIYLKTHTATASMVTEATGVPQKNICRYKRDLEKAGLLREVKKAECQVTGFKAWYLTTDKSKFTKIPPHPLNAPKR